MTFFTEDHLRVQKPITSNGINPVVGSDGKIAYKTVFLPITAKKFLEKKNAKLPEHLRTKIEVVPGCRPAPAVDNRLSDAEQRIKELEAQLAATEKADAPKRGRPAKSESNETN
jgi:hypothetical protein